MKTRGGNKRGRRRRLSGGDTDQALMAHVDICPKRRERSDSSSLKGELDFFLLELEARWTLDKKEKGGAGGDSDQCMDHT